MMLWLFLTSPPELHTECWRGEFVCVCVCVCVFGRHGERRCLGKTKRERDVCCCDFCECVCVCVCVCEAAKPDLTLQPERGHPLKLGLLQPAGHPLKGLAAGLELAPGLGVPQEVGQRAL